MATFQELGLCIPVIRAIVDMGFEEMTPIQELAIPIALAGRDLIGQAQTGTGKTAAFGIPLMEKAEINNENIQGLVITPTRELAIQVAEELNRIGQFRGVRALPLYGGQDINRQIRSLKSKPGIIVGTPGRLMDHMRRRTVRLQNARFVVLDEADEMLNMGFIEDIETIFSAVPGDRQTMLFSATMPKPIQELAGRFMKNPEIIGIKSKEITVPNTEQHYYEVPERQKFDVLCRLLDIQSPDSAIVFGRTRRRVDELFEALNKRGYSAEGIHGDLAQPKRDSVMRNFRAGATEILAATDVAARGWDIGGITHIYNFDIPQDPESYVHRIGRTGRLGKPGLAITFVTPRELGHLRLIEKTIKRKIVRKTNPTFNDAIEGRQRLSVEKIIQAMKTEDISAYKEIAGELLEENDSVTLLSAALKLLTKEPNTDPVRLTEEAPLARKKPQFERGRKPPSHYERQSYKKARHFDKKAKRSKDNRY
jgi:ATP-dependent RNA helicase DeaD